MDANPIDELGNTRSANRGLVVVVVGYLLWFILAAAICAGIYELDYSKPSAMMTSTLDGGPLATPTPHILAHQTPDGSRIFEEYFQDNRQSWTGIWETTNQVSVHDNGLSMKSLMAQSYVVATCSACVSLPNHYFLQADLSTDNASKVDLGIVFQISSHYPDDFYAYLINPKLQEYFFYDHRFGRWSGLTSGPSNMIRPYPASNTLGLYIQTNLIEFYVNGEMLDSYQESNITFGTGGFGFLLGNSGTEMTVRNVVVYALR